MKHYRRTSFNWLIVKLHNDAIIENRGIFKGRVVDLGCGTAPYKEEFLEWADEYVGVDWPESLHDRSAVDVTADLTRPLPFDDGYADTVVSLQVMEHLPDPRSFLEECYRILKPGGHILLTTPFMWHIHEAPHDYYRYTCFGLKHLLEGAGFSDVRVEPNTGYWQTAVLKFNYYSNRFARGPLRWLLIPLWWIGQELAPRLDRFDYRPGETAGYTALARRPLSTS